MTSEWQDIPEEDGTTLGPEEALEREIAKSKALKVERLQLKDQVERLTIQNRALHDQLEALKQKREQSPGTGYPAGSQPAQGSQPNRWAVFLLVFNLAAVGLLLIYLL